MSASNPKPDAVETLLDLTNRELDLVTGVRTHECERMRVDWTG